MYFCGRDISNVSRNRNCLCPKHFAHSTSYISRSPRLNAASSHNFGPFGSQLTFSRGIFTWKFLCRFEIFGRERCRDKRSRITYCEERVLFPGRPEWEFFFFSVFTLHSSCDTSPLTLSKHTTCNCGIEQGNSSFSVPVHAMLVAMLVVWNNILIVYDGNHNGKKIVNWIGIGEINSFHI